MELNFYEQPFRLCKYSDWVYDFNNNFVFQFESRFDSKGNYLEGERELQNKVIESLNSEERTPIEGLNLKTESFGEILREDKLFILIRGWGNLTGVGAHNFDEDKAAKIQDNFQEWLLYRLN